MQLSVSLSRSCSYKKNNNNIEKNTRWHTQRNNAILDKFNLHYRSSVLILSSKALWISIAIIWAWSSNSCWWSSPICLETVRIRSKSSQSEQESRNPNHHHLLFHSTRKNPTKQCCLLPLSLSQTSSRVNFTRQKQLKWSREMIRLLTT